MPGRFALWLKNMTPLRTPTKDALFAFLNDPTADEPIVYSVSFEDLTGVVSPRTLPILSSMPPFSGRNAAALEVVESLDASTDKPLIAQLRFDASTIEGRQWVFECTGAVGTPVLRIGYKMASANIDKDVVLVARVASVSDGDALAGSVQYYASNSLTERVPNTADEYAVTTITLDNAINAAQNDWLNLLLYRDASNAADNASGDLIISYVRFEWSS